MNIFEVPKCGLIGPNYHMTCNIQFVIALWKGKKINNKRPGVVHIINKKLCQFHSLSLFCLISIDFDLSIV